MVADNGENPHIKKITTTVKPQNVQVGLICASQKVMESIEICTHVQTLMSEADVHTLTGIEEQEEGEEGARERQSEQVAAL